MAALPMKIKRFVTASNACFRSPSQVVQDVAEEFGVVVTKAQVQRYHPQRAQGYSLHQDLRVLFADVRRRFVEEEEASRVPISYRAVRLEALQRMYEKAEGQGNLRIALGALKAAHAECVAFEVYDDPSDEDEDDDNTIDIGVSLSYEQPRKYVHPEGEPGIVHAIGDPFAPIPDGPLIDPEGLSPTTIDEDHDASS